MTVRVDTDLEALAEFMQSKFPAARLVSLAESIAALAPSLWGRYQPEPVQALVVEYPLPVTGCASQTRQGATE